MPSHKTLKSVPCRAEAQAINNFYNAIPLHEREAAVKAERHLEPGVLLIMIAALRTAAAGLGWVCSPCKSATCSTQKRGYKANSQTPVNAVNWSRVGFPTFAAGFSGLCCPDASRCTTSKFAKDGVTRLGSGGGSDKRGNGDMCMCQCSKCTALNCAYKKEQGVVMRPHWFVDQSGDVNASSIIDFYHYEVNVEVPMTAIQAAKAAAKAAERAANRAAKQLTYAKRAKEKNQKKAAKVAKQITKRAKEPAVTTAATKPSQKKRPRPVAVAVAVAFPTATAATAVAVAVAVEQPPAKKQQTVGLEQVAGYSAEYLYALQAQGFEYSSPGFEDSAGNSEDAVSKRGPLLAFGMDFGDAPTPAPFEDTMAPFISAESPLKQRYGGLRATSEPSCSIFAI